MERLLTDVEEYLAFEAPAKTGPDCDFICRILSEVAPPPAEILDLGCGTGRHALDLAGHGYSVTGVDRSPERVAYASAQAEALYLRNCQFITADLLELDLCKQFSAAICLFNTFSLFTSNDAAVRLFRNIRDHLNVDGIWIVHLYSMWPAIAAGTLDGGEYEAVMECDGVTRSVTGRHIISNLNNTYEHHRRIHDSKDARTTVREEVVRQRMFTPNEIDLLCRLTGLQIQSVYDGMDPDRRIADFKAPIDDPSGELVFCLARQEGSE